MANPTHVQLFNGQALVTGGGVFEPDALIPQPPGPPTNVSADTPIGTSGQALVTFTSPANTGNIAINEYVGISVPGNIVATCPGTQTQISFSGLTLGASYTFFVQSVNSVGTSLPSAYSNPITPTYYPAAPVIGIATAGVAQMSVAFTPVPLANNGGTPITEYIATTSPGGFTGTGTTSPIVITGLTNGTQYNATVAAVNAYGTGPASAASNYVTPQSALTPPGTPGNFRITGQGNNSITLAWNAASAGSYPVASYNIYRNGAFLLNVSSSPYTDNTATNANMPNSGGYPITTQGPSTNYSYTVSAVDNQGNEGTQQQILSWQAYINGTNNGIPSSQDYSYLLTPNYTDTTMAPAGGTADIRCDITAAGGIWQPTFGGNVSRWTLNAGMMDHFQCSIKPTVAGQDFSISIVSRQQSPTGDVFSTMHTNVSTWTTLTANQWNNVIIPLSAMSVGDTVFVGKIGAPYTTVTIDTNGDTYHAATLTVTSVVSGPGVDVGAFITGTNVPTGTYLWSSNSGNTSGPFIITGPNVPASLSVSSETMTCWRHDLYKLTAEDLSGLSSNHFGFDNVKFYGTQTLGVNGTGVPSVPQNVVASPGNGQVSVSYSAPSSQGGSAIVSYTFTTTDLAHTITGTTNPLILTGLTNGVSYSGNLYANNSQGQSVGALVGPFVPQANATVPSAPTSVVATPGNARITLTWATPSSNGGSAITGYLITSTDGSVSQNAAAGTNSAMIIGLTNGKSYTLQIVANNSVGPSSPGVALAVTPEPSSTTAAPVLSTWAFIGGSYVATMSVQYVTVAGTYAALFNQPSTANEYMQTQMVVFQGTGTLIESSDNEGPNPPSTATGTLSMTALNNETAGDTNITMFTGACYGNMTYVGQHSNRALSDTENGGYVLAGYLQGQDQQQGGSINQSQENDVFYFSSIVGDSGGTRNVWTGTYTGGDGDYEALLNTRWRGLGTYIGYKGNIQNNVAPGNNVLTSGSITLTAAQVPATIIGWCNNLSSLGSHFTPSVGVALPFAPLVTNYGSGSYGSATAGSGSASVSFTPATQPSGTPTPTSFTVVAYPGGSSVTGASSPLTVPNLAPGNYAFTVYATNSNGNGPASPPFGQVTIAGSGVPTTPTNITASAGNGQATVGWAASNPNGSAITGYTITAAFGDTVTKTVGPTVTSTTITGLTNGVGVAFYVYATNGNGNSANSANSPTVTPQSNSNTPGYDGTLTVSGANLLNGHGVILQPRGGNAEGLDYGAIQKLATWPNGNTAPPYSVCQAWKMNMMRIPLNAASWLGLTVYDPGNASGNSWGASMQADYNGDYKSTVIATARALQAAGMYVMFDVHLTAPQFTFNGVTHWLRPNNAPYYPDAMCLAFWQSFALTFGTQATPQPGVNNNGIIFNIMNEPHGVFGSGGPYTKGPNGSGGTASSDYLFKNGGYGSQYAFLAFPYTGSWVSGTINQSWQVISYQQIVNAIRATGAKNIIAMDSDSYATMAQTTLNWVPTDTLSPAQFLFTLHPYGEGQFGSYPYTGNGIYPYSGTDTGAGTSSWSQWFIKLIQQGYAVCFSEDGGHYGSGQVTEPHISYILGLADQYNVGYLTWGFNSANQFGSGSSGWMQALEQVGGVTVPTPGQGTVTYNWMVNHAP